MSSTELRSDDVVCFSGKFRYIDLTDAAELARGYGCTISKNLTNRVSKVVIGENPANSTLARAIEDGIELITEKQFCEFFDVEYSEANQRRREFRPNTRGISDDLSDLSRCVVLDVETTGLYPEHDFIVSVAALKLDLDLRKGENQKAQSIEALVKPPISIPSEATRVHGITNRMIRNSPSFGEEAQEIREFIGDLPVVGHNVQFDLNFLNAEFRRAGVDTLFENEAYCTMRAYRNAYSGRASLDAVLDAFDLEGRSGKFHGALEDVRLTAEVAFVLANEAKPGARISEATQQSPPKRSSFWKYVFGFLIILALWMSFRTCQAASEPITHEDSLMQNASSQIETTGQIQVSLHNLGYEVTVDGIFGPETQEAIKKYQRENDLAVTDETHTGLLNMLLRT